MYHDSTITSTEREVDQITRSGRYINPNPSPAPEGETDEEGTRREKGKDVATEMPQTHKKKGKAPEEEIEKLHYSAFTPEYDLVQQLNKTPAQISIMRLLLDSDKHKDVLMKILGDTHMPDDISPEQLETVMSIIATPKAISFSSADLPPEGYNHTEPLFITVRCSDLIVRRVMIDNGSALNICPVRTFHSLQLNADLIKPSSNNVRGFDNTKKDSLGEVTLEVAIAERAFFVTFELMDINTSFNLLIGRPWLHQAGAVPSTLHRMIQFVSGNQLITVHAENHREFEQGGGPVKPRILPK